MKTILLITLIIVTLVFLYVLYAIEINKKLNIKKREMAIVPNQNRYRVVMLVSLVCLVITGSLFIVESLKKDYDVVKRFKSLEEYQYFLTKNSDIEGNLYHPYLSFANTDKTIEDEENIYFIKDNQLSKYNMNEERLSFKQTDKLYDKFFLLDNEEFVIYITISDVASQVIVYEKEDLNIYDKIEVDGYIECGYIENNILHIIMKNDALEDPSLLCIQSMNQTQKYLTNFNYVDCSYFNKILTHIKVNLNNKQIEQKSICLTDYFMIFSDQLYIFCNAYNENRIDNRSYVIKYNIQLMEVEKYISLDWTIYTNPVVCYDVDKYMKFISYDIDNNTYHLEKISTNLVLSDSYIINLTLDINTNEKGFLLKFDKKIKESVLTAYFDNRKAITLKNTDEYVLINEFDLVNYQENEYRIVMPDNFTNFTVLDYKAQEMKDEIRLSYMIDDQYGYINIDKNITQENRLMLHDGNDYYLTDNYILIISPSNIVRVLEN